MPWLPDRRKHRPARSYDPELVRRTRVHIERLPVHPRNWHFYRYPAVVQPYWWRDMVERFPDVDAQDALIEAAAVRNAGLPLEDWVVCTCAGPDLPKPVGSPGSMYCGECR